MGQNKRIPQLPDRSEGAVQFGELPAYNPESDKTEKSPVQELIGAVRAAFDWNLTTTYSIDDLVLDNRRVWKSLIASNLGNVPSENANWTERPISIADGITDTDYAVGVFTYDSSKVVYNNLQYYLQVPAPFESTDFVTELANGDWATSQETPTPISITGGATNILARSGQYIIELLDSVGYLLQESSTVTDNTVLHSVKNVSGGNATLTTQGVDTIENETNQTLSNSDSITIYLEGTKYTVI